MLNFIFTITVFTYTLTASASKSFIGKWIGYCDALVQTQSSQICSYIFNQNKSGLYTCEKFKDLRCTLPNGKKTELIFSYSDKKIANTIAKLNLNFSSGDLGTETVIIKIDGDILTLNSKDATEKGDKSPTRVLMPPIHYIRDL